MFYYSFAVECLDGSKGSRRCIFLVPKMKFLGVVFLLVASFIRIISNRFVFCGSQDYQIKPIRHDVQTDKSITTQRRGPRTPPGPKRVLQFRTDLIRDATEYMFSPMRDTLRIQRSPEGFLQKHVERRRHRCLHSFHLEKPM